jgi:pyruvate ferredoxin oxidoreductase gamma subunit
MRGLMYQVRLHGRGGQGVVTAAELVASAAIADGRYALAFPSFGSERTGAPVEAYCRIDQRPIRAREPVTEPDLVVVLDPTLLGQGFVWLGLDHGGTALINATGQAAREYAAALTARRGLRVYAVPATELARRHTGRPLPNVPMLGALAAVSGAVSLDAVLDAITRRFPPSIAQANAAAAAEAFEYALREGAASSLAHSRIPGGV